MTTLPAVARPGTPARILAVLSVLAFWLLPFSPFVAIGAMSLTSGTTTWPRRWARIGAILCSAYTILMATAIAALAWRTWGLG